MTRLLRHSLASAAAIVLALAALASEAEGAYPGEPGPIAYSKYRDVGEIVGESEELHPQGGLFAHGPRLEEQPLQLTSEASDGEPAYSPNGRLIAFASTRGRVGPGARSQLYLMRSDGTGLRQLTDDPTGADGPYFSPDGRRLVFARSHHLWLLRIASGAERQLTFGRAADREPVFTPNGRRILFASNRAQGGGAHDSSDIWAVGSDGRNPKVLVNGAGAEMSPEVSPDGRQLAYVVQQSPYFGYGNLSIARADGRFMRSLDEKPGPECGPCYGSPAWAPDGKHLAAVEIGDNVGSSALMVMRPDGTHRKRFDEGTVATAGAGGHVRSPAWGAADRGSPIRSFKRAARRRVHPLEGPPWQRR
jgi:Tol biopolymer transport system component